MIVSKFQIDKLPYVLDEEQKKNKVKNNLQILRKNCKIEPNGRIWHLSKTKNLDELRQHFRQS